MGNTIVLSNSSLRKAYSIKRVASQMGNSISSISIINVLYLLKGDHHDVDDGDVVDGVTDQPRFIVQRFSISYVVANSDTPRQK